MAKYYIGTASWTDPGFIEDWYPRDLPASRRLRWYAEHFNYVEVNATFYAIPGAKTVERWCDETPDDFVFDVKLPKVLSRHSMRAGFLPPDLRGKLGRGEYVRCTPEVEKSVVQRLLREVKPLIESKKLGAFLLQMSPGFRPKNHQIAELDSIRDLLAPHALAVELRNRDWVIDGQLAVTIDYFKSRHITLVLVDAPASEHFTVMPGLNVVTKPSLAYFRLHGRNAQGYIKGRSVAERFDYDYPPSELCEMEARIREVAKVTDEIHVAANNNRSSFAPKTAEWLAAALMGGTRRSFAEQQSELPLPR